MVTWFKRPTLYVIDSVECGAFPLGIYRGSIFVVYYSIQIIDIAVAAFIEAVAKLIVELVFIEFVLKLVER